ncbi:MAG: bifunctional heptose 7-phosphate kinase/heptose 1-phosphate adenyltransferase [Opitutales bacterium]
MTPDRFDSLLRRFRTLRIGIVGDFSLDRYFDIDPARAETSLETGLPVLNVTRVRCQPGAAGNITANLAALGAATLWPVGYSGDDGEGFDLRRALGRVPGVRLDHFHPTTERLTFAYSKPLLHHRGRPPEELSRLDLKNWTPTPAAVEARLVASLRELAPQLDALVVMDQAGVRDLGAITPVVLGAVADLRRAHPRLPVVADSRHDLGKFPPLIFKMNAAEFAALTGRPTGQCHLLSDIAEGAAALATRNGQAVFVTLAGEGIVGAAPGEPAVHVPARPLRGPIDIVGAGDTVTATLCLALAAGASLREALELAQAAASLVIHQLGTTGVANPAEMRKLLFP